MQRRGCWFDLIHRCANAAPTSTPFGRAAATSPPQRQAAPPSMQSLRSMFGRARVPWRGSMDGWGFGGGWEREREAGSNCAAMSMSTAHCHRRRRRRRLQLLFCRRQRREGLDRLVPSAGRPTGGHADSVYAPDVVRTSSDSSADPHPRFTIDRNQDVPLPM